ncbi:MAG TPA: hypothetical protein VGC97_05320 [Pyrinomonadaceae bacterium]
MAAHVPMSYSGELINGELPMLLDDLYVVAGCAFSSPYGPSPCIRVVWTNPSATKSIGGVPALTNASIGLVQSRGSAAQGVVFIASHRTVVPINHRRGFI